MSARQDGAFIIEFEDDMPKKHTSPCFKTGTPIDNIQAEELLHICSEHGLRAWICDNILVVPPQTYIPAAKTVLPSELLRQLDRCRLISNIEIKAEGNIGSFLIRFK